RPPVLHHLGGGRFRSPRHRHGCGGPYPGSARLPPQRPERGGGVGGRARCPRLAVGIVDSLQFIGKSDSLPVKTRRPPLKGGLRHRCTPKVQFLSTVNSQLTTSWLLEQSSSLSAGQRCSPRGGGCPSSG